MTNNELKIQIPEDPITAADTVGRAIRITRLHWRVLLQFFIVPIFLYDLSATLLIWEPEALDTNIAPTVSYWLMASSFIVMCLSTWVVETKRFALLLFIAGGYASLDEALKAAKKRMWLILILLTPVLVCEMIGEGFFMLTQFVMRGVTTMDMPSLLAANIMFTMLILMLLMYLPTLCVGVINAFFVSIVVFDKATIFQAVTRFFRIGIPMFSFFLGYTLLMALAHCVVFIPAAFMAPLNFLLPKNVVATVFEFVVTTMLEAPIYSFLAAAVTIGGACLYKQLCASLEGQDILDKLKVLEAKS